MTDFESPHVAFPFRLRADGRGVALTEQDSDDEVFDCVEVLLRTERGTRTEIPDYGISDQAFKLGGADIDEIRSAVRTWEDRAVADITRTPSALTDMVDRLRVEATSRGANA